MVVLYKIKIDSDSYSSVKYDVVYVKWDDEEVPWEIICSCKGYKYHGKCKHIDRYDPSVSELWRDGKKM